MKGHMFQLNRAEITGIFLLIAAGAGFFVHPLLSVVLFLLYVFMCVGACFFPGTNFLGPVVSRGRTDKNEVALTFDDGPSPATTPRILDLLDRHSVKATFFVSGINALQFPDLISEIVRRGHSIGNHSLNHDPFVMLKGYRILYREVDEAGRILQKMGIETRTFRPPVGIINPELPSILAELGLICVTFSCRAYDAGNRRVKNLAAGILKKVKRNDIILLHDRLPHRREDDPILMTEIEKILTGLSDKKLQVVPLSGLIGIEIMNLRPQNAKKIFD